MKQRLNGSMRGYKWINAQFVTIELICANADMVVVVILTEASVEQWSWITYTCSLKNKLRTSQTFKGNANNDYDFDMDTPFCPWCGSKMDKEE